MYFRMTEYRDHKIVGTAMVQKEEHIARIAEKKPESIYFEAELKAV